MARGRSQSGVVRSHRRGRRRQQIRRRLPVAPWIVITTVAALVASGLVGGYAFLLGAGCSGDPIKATVAAPPEIQGTLQTVARQWQGTEPSAADGQCIGVDVVERSSRDVVTSIWAGDKGGKSGLPHIWVPESKAWMEMAKISDRGKSMLPDSPPLIATSPAVIAMPTEAAKTLGWQPGGTPKEKAGKPTWTNLMKLATESNWGDFGKDEWGDIKIGVSNPMASTADLHALLSIVDAEGGDASDVDDLGNVTKLKELVAEEATSVTDMIDKVGKAAEDGDPVGYVSAFPATERDIWMNNRNSNAAPLTAVYPADGSFDADHPFAVLQDVSWTNAVYQDIGDQFAEYLIGQGQKYVKQDGFRDGTRREAGEDLAGSDGLTDRISVAQRDVIDSDTVQNTLAAWQALAQPANVLVVVDSSNSMRTKEPYNGENLTRMEIVRKSLQRSLGLFGEQASVGLWRYPFNAGTGQAFQELVTIGKFDEAQQQSIETTLGNVEPASDGGLNDTVVEAYRTILNEYNDTDGAVNLVVVISDGGEESGNQLSDKDVTRELKDLAAADRDKQAKIMTIGYGDDVDKKHLEAIATATRGQYYPAKWNDEINTLILGALYYN